MNQEFKGRVGVEIDEKALSAKLRFIPDDEGDVLNIDMLRQILQNENVVYGIDEEALSRAAEVFSDAKEEILSDLVAKGDDLDPDEEDFYEISAMDYPPDLEHVVSKIRSLNKPPLIYKTMKTIVKKDRRVRDKGLFKGGKEKIITVDEEVEKKIRVDVSSEVREIGFFHQGDVVCTVKKSSDTEKKSVGMNVYGKELKIQSSSNEKFLHGKNIKKEKDEYIADITGFARVGDNWIDVVPFAVHSWSVDISGNKADCSLNITAGHKAAPIPKVSAVKKVVEETGYPLDKLLPDEKIQRIIRQGCQSGVNQTHCLSKDQDGDFDIKINLLATEASLYLKKGVGKGSKLNLKKVWAKVLELRIQNFEADRVRKEILGFHSSDQLEITILLGKGEEPERGEGRELLIDVKYINQDRMNFILERMDHLRKPPDSFDDFPKQSIQKMALVNKGAPVFHLGEKRGGKNGRDIYGNVIPGIEGNDPDLKVYENIVIQEGTAVSKIEGILDYSYQDSIHYFRIREHMDARIIVSVAETSMSASVSVLPPKGSGELPTKESLMEALNEKGVVQGIKGEVLNSILEKTGKEEFVTDHIVAEGKVPFQGDEVLQFLVEIQPGKKNAIPINAGDVIAQISSENKEESVGYNVLGEQLFGESRSELDVDEYIKTEETEEGKQLIAGEKGLLCMEENRLYIRNKQVIQGDISRTMGNINFPGTVEILGSVLSGIFVKAGNDLKIRDVVESSLLSSDGSILIGKGVKGDQKAVLRANKNINLGFAENSNIMANGNIGYKKALMNCQIKCNGKILSQSKGARIIGGRIKTKNGLTADIIGSERGAATFISFGQDYLVEDQISVMTKEIDQIGEQLETLETMMQTAEQKGQQKKLMGLRKKKVQLLKVQEKKVVKNFLMKDKFELHFDSEVKVSGSIYPGTVFESHGRKLEIKEHLTSTVIFFDSSSGKISTKRI